MPSYRQERISANSMGTIQNPYTVSGSGKMNGFACV